MHVQPLFATWAADWDLFGAPVWFFLASGIIASFFVSWLSPLVVTSQRRLLPWLPTFMLVGCLFTRWVRSRSAWFLDWYFYKYYYAHLDIAFIVCFAFGVAFTLDLLRTQDQGCRIVGWLFVPVYLSLLAGALWYIQGWYGKGSVNSIVLFLIPFTPVQHPTAALMRRHIESTLVSRTRRA